MARSDNIATREVCRVILSAAKDLETPGRFFAALRMTDRATRCGFFERAIPSVLMDGQTFLRGERPIMR